MLKDNIWSYINSRVDNDGVLPSEDEMYTEFVYYFEALGFNADVIAEVVKSYCDCSDLEGVQIDWEGDLDAFSPRRTLPEPEVSPKTA